MSDETQASRPTQVLLDSRSIRVLAHPLRSRLLGRLRVEGPATATQLATRLGTNSGATSYHLRKLAEVGLVVEDITSGDARDRWWRAAHDYTTWSQDQFLDDPDDRAAATWLIGDHLRMNTAKTQDWLDAAGEWPREWVKAADLSDYRLLLTATQAAELTRELDAVITRYRVTGDLPATGTIPREGEATSVAVILHVHPWLHGPR
ncbi:MAG: helix-turn-helix domain-containing protein [Sporichthyaceae bacterium]